MIGKALDADVRRRRYRAIVAHKHVANDAFALDIVTAWTGHAVLDDYGRAGFNFVGVVCLEKMAR